MIRGADQLRIMRAFFKQEKKRRASLALRRLTSIVVPRSNPTSSQLPPIINVSSSVSIGRSVSLAINWKTINPQTRP